MVEMDKKYELIIFDLDGTLLDTSQGIFNSVRYAEKQMGLLPVADSLLEQFVGPPPKQMYMKYYELDESMALKAAQKHREYGRTKAVYEAAMYPNMENTLDTLKKNGYKLAVATLKSQDIAEVILENFNLKKYFNVILGMDAEEKLTKSMIINKAINKCKCKGKTVMIGDSTNDFIGACEAKVDFIGVTYGFGYNESQSADYQFSIAKTPEEILNFV